MDELIEALEQIGAKPKRSEVTVLVRELNKGEDEMDLDVFEMLMTRAYSTRADDDESNILTNGTVGSQRSDSFDWCYCGL
mgnify:CR=1 FL=1